MSTEHRSGRPTERVAPELAIARLGLRQISLLAAHPLLTASERQQLGSEHAVAHDAGEAVLALHATTPDRPLDEVARLFFGFYFVFPNLGLAGPFFDDDVRPLREAAWIAAYDSLLSGVSVRDEFHARLWSHICDEDRRAVAARRYAVDRSLHSFPPSASPAAVERYRRRIDTLMASAECVPALLALWAIEQNPRRLDDLAKAELKGRSGLLEQRDMARFLGMRPNTLAQTLKRFRARLGEEMRVLWQIDKTAAHDEDEER
jgi:hypothetical protein